MTVIVCLDDKDGMMFGTRRQSQDGVLRDRILNDNMGKKLYMNEYSYKMFSQNTENYAICDENFLDTAQTGDVCFVENVDILPYESKINKIIIYRWNRAYPATVYFKFPCGEWKLEGTSEIGGSSHDITEQIYIR
ncbi:MAG: ribonuclease Z [Ruminococcaceae bacterium]|nr:ribonuclease Z [Oscillospiraceae bacterium]